MLEYLSLMNEVEKDIPLAHKRGMMDVLSRITHYMNNEELKRYEKLSHELMTQLPRSDKL